MSESSKKLEGKVAVVTGASKGIGAAIAKELGARGASVVVNYATSKEGAETVVAAIEARGGRAMSAGASVAAADDVAALFAKVKGAYGKVDILVNNAGVYGFTPIEAVTPAEFHKYFDVNVMGMLLATKGAVALMPAGGVIINIGSNMGEIAPPNSSVYVATKGAVNALTRSLAKELAPRKIRVLAVNPGATETEGLHAAGMLGGDFEKMMVSMTPMGRVGRVEDIAPVVAFLASDEARWVTGSWLDVAGGMR
jgi:3-oxoacyl-[acyl-carrier protein] reductase